jgi:hypothetical protein
LQSRQLYRSKYQKEITWRSNIKNAHRKKRSSLLDSKKKKEFMERKRETIIIDSDFDQSCTGISIKMRDLKLKAQMMIAMNATFQIRINK